MHAAAAISQHPVAALAVGELAGSILEQLDGAQIDLLVVFADSCHTGAIDDVSSALRELLHPGVLLGTTACGVIGQISEVEDAPAISVWAASGIDAKPLRVEPGAAAPTSGWPQRDDANVLLLADPFTTPLEDLFAAAMADGRSVSIHGGFASAARGPGGNRLLLDGEIHSDGAVGVDLGNTALRSVVSQGCRPIGRAYTVTGANRNVITELASQRPLDVLESIARDASAEDQQVLGGGIHVGLVFDETKVDEYERGDFLIRAVMGADQASGAIAIGAEIEVGATVQFQVRDAQSASDDLSSMLSTIDGGVTSAALTFTCNGRGERLFGRAGHDAEMVHAISGSTATAGMFCAGEFGPVGDNNHVHGFTASTLLFD